MAARMRILTGIQPTGALHLGNYFGAMRPAINLQTQGEGFYFIADLHSMTSLFDPRMRLENVLNVALDFMACGLDPKKCVFFRQSEVPEVTELTWILSPMAPMGLLERCHSYKDKLAKGVEANHALFSYPLLMAADILLYETNVVPVGKDQKQHVEVTRDIAIKFNNTYGQTFVIPEPQIQESVSVVPGVDGQKMSKSYNNTISIFGDEKSIRKRIMGIQMDSRSPAEPKPDADKNSAIILIKLMAEPSVAQEYEDRLRVGGLGYGDLKKALFEIYWNYFEPARKRRAELVANLDYVRQSLKEAAEKARTVAAVVLDRARKASGIGPI